eukprot:TRINITY_DN2216_c0_g1_i2.p1 TRINITY_DN2216_c0_g1~~TRINITY_DN2216_c0_g1_i2.p1  ORF type:complete len:359 (-),score=33.65 TRINITY_DN2216_c0_g1_i2:79-1155(-)
MPSLERFPTEYHSKVKETVSSPEYQEYAKNMRSCEKTITVDMSRRGGQFGSQFNTELMGFSILSLVTDRSLVFDWGDSILGRWCRIFVSLNTCPAKNNETAFHVSSNDDYKISTHFLLPSFPHNHLYFLESNTALFLPIGRELLTYWLKKDAVETKDQLVLFRKFSLYIWQLPQSLITQMKSLMEVLKLDGPFVGAHVRWGDKKSESNLISADAYALYLRKIAEKAQTKTIFVMSDSAAAITELQVLLPGFLIRTTTPPSWIGNDLKGWKDMSLEEREAQLVLLVLELTIMSQAEHVVCMMSSNVCRLLQLIRIQPEDTLLGIEITGTDKFACKWLGSLLGGDWYTELCIQPVSWGPF